MNALNGKVAVIGGASSGIGKAAALLFARQGAALVLGARREPLLAELVEDIRREGGRALAVAGDVRDEAFAERLTATAVDEFGGLDIAFNNAGKSGLIGLTQALAVEFGGRGIRVNALLPGGTDTAMGRQMSHTPEALAQVAELHALKRLAVPEEIAQAALYLASDAASFVTGTAMLVDGGVSIQRG
ncbi:TPA: SDR family oxidoreductase [Serratia marcescens]|nr:SDR family oxidoreductase [Serratia marcescens]HBU7311473.1 SDR family oxidoreductase [Serratia marcescens]